jgi:Iron-containing redox enzyme
VAAHTQTGKGGALFAKIALVRPVLEGAAARVWADPFAAQIYPEYLIALHGVVRASVPLMEEALGACRARAAQDAVAAGMVGYLQRHIEEERGHDRWLLEDLQTLGVSPADVWARPPADSTARAVGAQYYWIRHHHPVTLLGYIAVVEGRPPDPAFLDRTAAETGLPAAAFRTLFRHAESDVVHGSDLRALLDALPLQPAHESLLARSAVLTVAELTETLLGVAASIPTERTESRHA